MPKYKATAYIRLSYTDDHSSESDSVSNQRKLIENFVERNPDIEVVSEKIDDGSKTFSIEVAVMKTAFYCRVDGQGFGFVLPDEADKLREFFAEHQDKPALENPSSAS